MCDSCRSFIIVSLRRPFHFYLTLKREWKPVLTTEAFLLIFVLFSKKKKPKNCKTFKRKWFSVLRPKTRVVTPLSVHDFIFCCTSRPRTLEVSVFSDAGQKAPSKNTKTKQKNDTKKRWSWRCRSWRLFYQLFLREKKLKIRRRRRRFCVCLKTFWLW